ncbi:MAG: ABC transporter transmembrane domain-containing protein, partial [Bacteroidales bacterium]|nr:ABC transporter transmembrane domain-containing protein [Bacteroidales bacterium]
MRKIPGIKQHHVSDCGAACLASVAAWFGLRFPLEHIRQISGTQTHGISVQGIREGAAALHLKASAYRLEDNVPAEKKAAALENLPFPSILHQIRPNGYTHFIVCYGRSRSRFRIMDPEDGRVHRVSGPDASALWTGVVITLSPDRHFKPGNHIPSFYFRMKVLMKGQKAEPVKALAASLLYTVAGLGSALFLKCIADRIIPSGDARFLTQMGLVMVYITVCALLLNMVRATFLLRNGLRTAMQLVMGFYRHLMYLPQRFFDQRPSGELIARINDAFKVSTFVSSGILNLVLYGTTLAVSFAVMFLFNWKLSLICLLSTPLYAAVYYFFDRRNKETQRRIMTAQATLESGLVDTLRGVTQIKYCTAQESAIKRTGEHFETYVRQALRGGMNQLYAAS